jgi:RNA methyltransferase, TrmH family
LVEGVVALEEALSAGAEVTDVFVSPGAAPEVESPAAKRGARVFRVNAAVLASLADTATPQGVVARARIPSPAISDLDLTDALVLVLADVRDPGNCGALMRSALAAGASGVIAARGSVDPLHPKTVRASAGAIFRVPVVRELTLEDGIRQLREEGLSIIGADHGAPEAFETTDLTIPLALVVGNEAWGLPPASASLLDSKIGIPMPGPAESLNAGIAGSILLFEAVRRRRAVGGTRARD